MVVSLDEHHAENQYHVSNHWFAISPEDRTSLEGQSIVLSVQ